MYLPSKHSPTCPKDNTGIHQRGSYLIGNTQTKRWKQPANSNQINTASKGMLGCLMVIIHKRMDRNPLQHISGWRNVVMNAGGCSRTFCFPTLLVGHSYFFSLCGSAMAILFLLFSHQVLAGAWKQLFSFCYSHVLHTFILFLLLS